MLLSINNYVLFILVILSIYFDLTYKKIPNVITFPAIIWGFIIHTYSSGFDGLIFATIGFIVGLLIYLIPFILGGMGAGDVKLMAAIGSLMGWVYIIRTAILAGLVGGVIVIIYLAYKKRLWVTFKSAIGYMIRPVLYLLMMTFKESKLFRGWYTNVLGWGQYNEKHFIPYGVAIGLGAIIGFLI